jgi:diguanylate cyclase (GGDEF)-like protein
MDELTGLFNRRGFVKELEKQLKTAKRNKCSSFLLFFDINDFKQINDRFGHEVGDEALVETTKILKSIFRSSDTIGRFGGDEFTVLSPQITDTADSRAIHERIEENVRQWNKDGKAEYELSLSFGIARFSPDNSCSADELISKADTLMYKQKQKHKKQRQV